VGVGFQGFRAGGKRRRKKGMEQGNYLFLWSLGWGGGGRDEQEEKPMKRGKKKKKNWVTVVPERKTSAVGGGKGKEAKQGEKSRHLRK